jgi:hypothetical protein
VVRLIEALVRRVYAAALSGENEDGGAWRERQVCLCVATQMGLTMSGALARGGAVKM